MSLRPVQRTLLLITLAASLSGTACERKTKQEQPDKTTTPSNEVGMDPIANAVGPLDDLSPELQRAFSMSGAFETLPTPEEGDWLGCSARPHCRGLAD